MDVPWIGDDDRAGDWIASRLGPFGTVGGNVPLGYEAYLSFANSDDGPGEVFDLMESFGSGERTRLDHLLDVLGPATEARTASSRCGTASAGCSARRTATCTASGC